MTWIILIFIGMFEYSSSFNNLFSYGIHQESLNSIFLTRSAIQELFSISDINYTKFKSEIELYKTWDTPQREYQNYNKFTYSSSEILPNEYIATNLTQKNVGLLFPLTESKPGMYFWSVYPEQIHLSWTENEDEICVMWVTYFEIDSILAYRIILNEENHEYNNWIYLYPETSIYDEMHEIIRLQYLHTVIISNLTQNAFYEYIIGNTWFWSEIYEFQGRTAYYQSLDPFKLSASQMVILGDLGIGPIGILTVKCINQYISTTTINGVIHLGDIAYDLNERDGRGGDEFLNMIQSISANYAYMVLPGNHESHLNFTEYRQRFRMPKNTNNENSNFFYSLNMGQAHYIFLNSELYFDEYLNTSAETQKNWLIKDLAEASANRKNVPWIIAMMHRPLYCSVDWSLPDPCLTSIECCSRAALLRDAFEDIFYNYSVDIVMQAHQHNYERTTPIYKNQSLIRENDDEHTHYSPRAPIYIMNGNGGNDEGYNDFVSSTPQPWSIVAFQEFGYGNLLISNSTHLYYEEISSIPCERMDYLHVIKGNY